MLASVELRIGVCTCTGVASYAGDNCTCSYVDDCQIFFFKVT